MRDLDVMFSGAVPAWTAGALFVIGAVVILWAYRRTRDRVSVRQLASLTALRLATLVLLLACLVEPVLSYRDTPQSRTPVLFLLDVSKSMSVQDMPGGSSRIDAALEPWVGPRRLARQLDRKFDVRYFVFDAATRPLERAADLESQQATGEMTLIGEALASAVAQTDADDPAGIVLLTDGANQSRLDPVAQARNTGAPVYVVAVGTVAAAHRGKPDLAVVEATGDRFMNVDVENALHVQLEQRGYDGRTAIVEVLDGDVPLASESVELTGASVDVRLRVVPAVLGKRRFEIVARPFDAEEITENNRRTFTAIVGKQQLNVLYIEGTPRWEYKFLKRALERDPMVQFTGFVRGKGSLFVRQGERVGSGVLPVTVDEFASFDTIILGDISPDLLSTGQLEAIRDAVTERGKGLAFLPGARSCDAGGFGPTPLADVLPALPVNAPPYTVSGDFILEVTQAGRDQPIFADLSPPLVDRDTLKLPACLVLQKPGPGASVLATHPSERRDGAALPICVVQFAGKGRAMVMAGDGTWRWKMNVPGGAEARTVHAKLWGQAVRWLANRTDEFGGDVPFMAYTSRDYYEPDESAILLARVIREDEGSIEADVTAEVRCPSGQVVAAPLEYVPGSGGLYRTELAFAEPGQYVAHVAAERGGESVGEDDAMFYVGRPYGEFDRIEMDEQLLRALAFETGGAFHTPDTAGAIPDSLVEAASKRAIFKEMRVARMPATYVLLVAFATIEWFLRRRKGLM